MVRISTPGLILGLIMVAAGVLTCVTAAPDDPRAFPAIEDLLIIGAIVVMAVSSVRVPPPEANRPR